MSTRLRNPFKLRASEKIESDTSFLRLFSPYVLDTLAEAHESGKLWGNVLFIHSSPGAGKTSLLRVFEPSTLNALLNNKSSAEFKDIYSAVKRIEVIKNDNIEVLGVSLSCNRNYQILDELKIPEVKKKRVFNSLLNARITLAFLRSVSRLKNLRFPEGLNEIQFNYTNTENLFLNLEVPCSGLDLYNWASKIERDVYKAIDSFLPEDINVEGHDEPFIVSVLAPENILVHGKSICSIILFMLDDAHKLSSEQRKLLEDYLIVKRGKFSLWISERLEALETRQNIGSFPERDFEEIRLERLWQDSPARFEKVLKNIAEKRAAISTEDVNTFLEYLDRNLNEERHKVAIKNALKRTTDSVNSLANSAPVFSTWLDFIKNEVGGSDYERLIALKQIEIVLERSIGKQLTIGFPYTKEQLSEKLGGEVRGAAELVVTMKSKIPYYYGFDSLSKLASNNIEQFLSYAAELFEEMISNKISGQGVSVSDASQEQIIQDVSNKKWKELQKIIPYAGQVTQFLAEFGKLAQEETYKPNAPYAPGVNGFAIKGSVNSKSGIARTWLNDESFEPLANVISTCVAYNLLEVKEVTQGKKEQKWDVYYLNRWLCVKFDLPLSYGGWRPKHAKELLQWITK
jgi:hypothetical protein